MRRVRPLLKFVLGTLVVGLGPGAVVAGDVDPQAAERGKVALTSTGYLKPAWSDSAYEGVAKYWAPPAPDVRTDSSSYASAFAKRYGLHPAPFPNDGLPMGLRKGNGPGGSKQGLAIDCLACHGGSIGGTSYVGLGNSQLDMKLLFNEMMKADGKRLPPGTFVINSSRGTVNAGMFSVILLSLRNTDLSFRTFPLPLGANLPELDVPAWWILGKKSTMYYDGRTEASSVRTNMQFLLGEKSLDEFKALEPTFRDIQAYLNSLTPPKYPFPIDRVKAEHGREIFVKTCVECHGTYGKGGEYPNRIIELGEIKTDPARANGVVPRFVAHYNATWFGQESPVEEKMVGYQAPPLDGIWATAPYLHNGSVPTVEALLNSRSRPAKFTRPPSTDFEYYDTKALGWKFDRPAEDSSYDKTRSLFDSSKFGLGNSGHIFGDRLSGDERSSVIEYLKTL